MKVKLVSINYGFEAIESYKKYTKHSESTNEDVKEIKLQFLLAGYEVDEVHAYWAWLQFCGAQNSPWMEVNSTYDVPNLLKPYVIIER